MFLSKSELASLTGAKKFHLQRNWLIERGYPFEIRLDGSPVVSKDFILSKLNKSIRSPIKNRVNLDALRKIQDATA